MWDSSLSFCRHGVWFCLCSSASCSFCPICQCPNSINLRSSLSCSLYSLALFLPDVCVFLCHSPIWHVSLQEFLQIQGITIAIRFLINARPTQMFVAWICWSGFGPSWKFTTSHDLLHVQTCGFILQFSRWECHVSSLSESALLSKQQITFPFK